MRPLPILAGACIAALVASPARATPRYSVSAAESCDNCHIKPIGWLNPGLFERACTLDCSGCHTSASGGGMRKTAGRYYGRQVLPLGGERPADHGDPEQYREPGDVSTGGVFRLWRGFSGWATGTGHTPVNTIDDRFGDMEPDPRYDVGGDVRVMGYFPSGRGAGEATVFPMQADVYGSARLGEHILTYGTAGLMGSRGRSFSRRLDDEGHIRNVLALREAFVQVDRFLPGQTYVRAGRFNKPYGWRLPDHTSFIRRPHGFDQTSQAFGVEAGFSPNIGWTRVMLFRQGWSEWPGDAGDVANGIAATAGVRYLPLTAGVSVQVLDRPERGARGAAERRYDELSKDELSKDELSYGFIWGLNAYPVVYLGELDVRRLTPHDGSRRRTAMYAYHELYLPLTRGVSALVKYDWLDDDTRIANDHRHRYAAGLEINPYTYTQVHLEYRVNELATTSGLKELLVITHVWF